MYAENGCEKKEKAQRSINNVEPCLEEVRYDTKWRLNYFLEKTGKIPG